MKLRIFLRVIAAVLLCSIAVRVQAQFLNDSPAGISAGMARLFDPITAFTATADVQVRNGSKETLRTPMSFSFLEGKMRMDIDLTQMKGEAVSPIVVTAMKQAGLHQVISVVRPDRKRIYLTFPNARSYADMEMSKSDAEATAKSLRIQKTALGKEPIGGREFAKNKVVVKNSGGATVLEAITWNAAEAKDFPVQIAVQTTEGLTVLRFTQIKFARPAEDRFDPPAGFARYPTPDALIIATAQKQNAASAPSSAPASRGASRPASSSAPKKK